ncbi:SDR family NAD(P)-dependent oxidoreductase [Nocardioides convexus]|uniref:SDR family NAD(P)-dependent oxidoreductase n=1 Tax=Nocardioides convexus TaxID=2712224 RepID=UPI00241841E7|nr:SDR family NAD(P)-dependent oxidoreductase [Nocardioides convexus]
MTSLLAPDAFAGRTIVLVGGGTGIGLEVARQVVSAGGRVVLGGRTAATLERAVAEPG